MVSIGAFKIQTICTNKIKTVVIIDFGNFIFYDTFVYKCTRNSNDDLHTTNLVAHDKSSRTRQIWSHTTIWSNLATHDISDRTRQISREVVDNSMYFETLLHDSTLPPEIRICEVAH